MKKLLITVIILAAFTVALLSSCSITGGGKTDNSAGSQASYSTIKTDGLNGDENASISSVNGETVSFSHSVNVTESDDQNSTSVSDGADGSQSGEADSTGNIEEGGDYSDDGEVWYPL